MTQLSSNRLVQGFSDAQLNLFYNSGRERTVGVGDIVIEEGSANSYIYLVLDGELEVILPETGERITEVSLAVLGPGDYTGEYGFLDGDPASATVRARQPSELFQIDHVGLDQMMEIEADIGRLIYRNLLLNLIARLRGVNDELDLYKPFS